jgi:hypothetical protein
VTTTATAAPDDYAVDCAACELFGEPVDQAEAADQLAATHDDIHHRGKPTATVRAA